MKLTFFFMVISLMSFTAKATAQKVSIAFDNVKVEKVLSAITQQTGLSVAYSKQIVNLDRRISIHVTDAEVGQALDRLIANTNLDYEVKNGKIYLFEKKLVASVTQQSKKVSGIVKDNFGDAVIGANVIVKGTTIGNMTDADGKFNFDVPQNATLQVSFIGFKTAEVKVTTQDFLTITLAEDSEALEEVVVVGYGTTKRRDVVGSITKISSDDLAKIPTTNIAESLQGMSSGMMVMSSSGHPGAAPQVKIRGINSINLSTDPLWIVDGVPIQTGSLETTVMGVKGVSPIAMLNPSDIESIEVLKDAAATAIYGNRGSGGVIIVTTKSNKGNMTSLSINYDGGVSQMPFSQDDIFVDSKTNWDIIDQAWANAGNKSVFQPSQILDVQFKGEKPAITREEALATNTDHLKAMTRNAWFHQIGLTANKGFETGGVMFSANYRDEKGLINNNDFKRLTMRFNFNFKPIESLEMGVNSSFLYMKTNGVKSNMNKGDGGWANWGGMLPWYKVYDETTQTGYWGVNSGFNAVSFSDRDLIRNDVDQYRTISNAYAQWNTPLDGLYVRGEAGVDLLVNNSTHWQSTFLDPEPPYIDEAFEKSITSSVINYNAYANYDKTINKHNFKATAGIEASRNWSYSRYAEGQQLQTIYPELINPLNMLAMGGSQGGDKYLMGIFGRLNYKLMDRYILNASFRRDGHSALSKDNRWANFYAFGAGWIMTDEAFMKGLDWLNLLKVRASYGITGNTAITNSMTYMTWGTDSNKLYGVHTIPVSTTVGPLGSSDLKWETTANLDLGFDFGLFNNRMNGSFAYYTQNVTDLILRGNVAPSVGFASNQIYENVGDLKNWGFEFNISSVNIETKDFRWKTDFNISTNNNKIKRLNDFEKGKGNEGANSIRKEGEALNTWYLPDYAYVDPEKGIYMMYERDMEKWNNEYVTVTTGKVIPMTNDNAAANKMIQDGKTPLPKFYGGFNNTFYYKNFDLNIMLNFAGGNWLMNPLRANGSTVSGIFNNIKDMVGKTWEKPGDIAEYPQIMWNSAYHYNSKGEYVTGTTKYDTQNTTRYLEKGDYIRLKNLQVGYTLPKSVVSRIKLNNVRFYLGVTNLFTITGYDGFDPETLSDLPIPRTINFGASVNL